MNRGTRGGGGDHGHQTGADGLANRDAEMQRENGSQHYAAADSGDRAQYPRKETKHHQKNGYHVAQNLRLAALREQRTAGSRGPDRVMVMFRRFRAWGDIGRSGYHPRRTGRLRLLVSVVAGAHHRPRFDVTESEAQSLVFQRLEFFRSVEARDGQMILRRPQILSDGENIHTAVA